MNIYLACDFLDAEFIWKGKIYEKIKDKKFYTKEYIE